MEAGFVVGERFTIERRAGAGGMATVYRAVDRVTGDVVALKLLGAVAERERFLREAEMLAHFDHPNIVRYVAHGELEDGTTFLAMEWLDGESLSDRLHQGPLPVDESLALCSIVARALGHAHARGIIHRDVKPSNVMLPASGLIGEARVLDFGIARRGVRRDLTRTGMLVGTPGYMAPEQARGSRDVDARADVFALGCLLYKCLTQRAPFVGESVVAVLAKVLLEEPTPLRRLMPDVPEHVERLTERLLAKDPDARPADGNEAAELLSRALRGESLERASAPSRQVLTALEQRMLSVLLLDLGAAPAPVEDPSDLDATATIVAVPDAVAACASSFGARLEALADGSILLTWQGAGTEHATRAARCALAVADAIPDVLAVLGTGRAVVGGAGVPVGDLLDRMDRLRCVALSSLVASQDASAILLDSLSATLLQDRFAVGTRGELSLLGPEREGGEILRTLLGMPTGCFGRDRELDQLTALFDECVDEGSPRAVLLKAPAGYGKSRVRHELVARVRGSAQIWMGRGDPTSAGAPFELFTRALRRAYAIRDDDPIETQRGKLDARVARHFGGAERGEIVAFVGQMIGLPPAGLPDLSVSMQDPVLQGDRIRAAVVSLLRAECATLPIVLVLEDLHWGDIPTVKLVDLLMRSLSSSPMFVLATARPEIDELFPRLWEDRSLLVLPLRELGRKAGEQLVRAALPDADDARVADLVERASGNAFHLEELIRAVAEHGSDVLPDTVLAMVSARFDRLDPEARRVLRAASVFGQAFWGAGVEAMVGDAGAGAHLAALVSQELVQPRSESRFERCAEYVFRNSAIRDAAYATLTEHDRAVGHRVAAAWLESVGETSAFVLAEHLERGGEPARALPYWVRAAEQAMEGNDFSRAAELAARGLACGPAPDAASRLHAIRAEALRPR